MTVTTETNATGATLQAEPRSLYAISVELLEIEHALADMDADPETVTAAVDAYLASSEELKEKVNRYWILVREFEARAKCRAEEAARLEALSKSDTRAAGSLKLRLHDFFKLHKIRKLETRLFKFGRQMNGGVRSLSLTVDVSDLPAKFQKTIPALIVPDMEAIRESIAPTVEAIEQIDKLNRAAEEKPLTPSELEDLATHKAFVDANPLPAFVVLGERGEQLRVR